MTGHLAFDTRAASLLVVGVFATRLISAVLPPGYDVVVSHTHHLL